MKRFLHLILAAAATALFFACSTSAQATNSDLSYVENYLTGAPTTYPYGTSTAASVSPCFSGGCQTAGGNPYQTSASSSVSVGGTGSAKASADLASGSLRAYAQEDGITGSSAAAGALFWDTLTFSGATGVSPTGSLVLTVPGTFTDVGYGGAGLAVSVGGYIGQFSPATWTLLDSSNPSATLTLPFSIVNGTPTEVGAGLFAAAYNSFSMATADLYDPPQLSLILPTGVTYTSASGVFLTTPVPEPTDAALLAAGLMLLGLRLRKRANQNVA